MAKVSVSILFLLGVVANNGVTDVEETKGPGAFVCPSGAIMVTEENGGELCLFCTNELGQRHGPYRKYSSGHLREEGAYNHGEQMGTWTHFFTSGRVHWQRTFEGRSTKAVRTEAYQEWDEDGTLRAMGTSADGQQVGIWKLWHPNGRLSSESNYHNGKLHGPLATWYADGTQRTRAGFRRGLPHGEWLSWWPSGVMKTACHWSNGARHGLCETWTEEGTPERRAFFDEGRLVTQRPEDRAPGGPAAASP